MSCQRCESERVFDITAKCNGCVVCHEENVATIRDDEWDHPVPKDMGIDEGDYLHFSYCLDCGQMQGNFPVIYEYEDVDDE